MTELVAQVLADPDNDLEAIARAFRASGQACWHIDRHVIAGAPDARPPDVELRGAACKAALALAGKWLAQRRAQHGAGLLISEPYAIIDDEWLSGEIDAPPPHVYLCLARDPLSLHPVRHELLGLTEASGNRIIDSLLTGRERLFRIEGAFDGEPGAWILDHDPE
jgi:hypothetical protein